MINKQSSWKYRLGCDMNTSCILAWSASLFMVRLSFSGLQTPSSITRTRYGNSDFVMLTSEVRINGLGYWFWKSRFCPLFMESCNCANWQVTAVCWDSVIINPMATLLSCVTTRMRILCNMNLIILSVCFKFREYKLHSQCFLSFFDRFD